MFACTPKTAATAFGFFEDSCGFPLNLFIFGNDHLRDSLARFDCLGVFRQVHDYTFYFAPVVAVDGSWGVEHSQPALGRKPAARPNLRFKTLWKFNVQTRWDEYTLKWLNGNGRFYPCTEVHASAACGFVLRQRIV